MIELRNATAKAIRYACMHFHYAKAVPSVQYGYNVYNTDDEWCGVILFGGGATPHIASPFGLVQGEVLELVRVALNGKQSCTSECVAAALKRLHRDAPQVKIIVSFADLDQHHAGIIYQATNWIYLGNDNAGARGAFIVYGKKMHPKSVHAKGWRQSVTWLKEHVDPNASEFKTEGKHKYIFVYDKRLRKQYLRQSKPYPKNSDNIDQGGA